MKAKLTYLTFVLSVMPFSYHKLDGPFKIMDMLGNGVKRLTQNTPLFYSELIKPTNINKHIFLYNREIGYGIGYFDPNFNGHNVQINNFFLGKNRLRKKTEGNWYDDYVNSPFFLLCNKPNSSQILLENCYKDSCFLKQTITIPDEISTIVNEDEVYIKTFDGVYLFQDQLEKYLKSIYYSDDHNRSICHQLRRLRASKILVVYGVFKDEENRITVWGSSRNNSKPEVKFNWFTIFGENVGQMLK